MNGLFGFNLSKKLDGAVDRTFKKFEEMSSQQIVELGRKHSSEIGMKYGVRYFGSKWWVYEVKANRLVCSHKYEYVARWNARLYNERGV